MITVDIHLFGLFRSISGKPLVSHRFPEGTTVGKVLEYLSGEYPKMVLVLVPEREGSARVIIRCNKDSAVSRESILNDGDQLYLFVALSGG